MIRLFEHNSKRCEYFPLSSSCIVCVIYECAHRTGSLASTLSQNAFGLSNRRRSQQISNFLRAAGPGLVHRGAPCSCGKSASRTCIVCVTVCVLLSVVIGDLDAANSTAPEGATASVTDAGQEREADEERGRRAAHGEGHRSGGAHRQRTRTRHRRPRVGLSRTAGEGMAIASDCDCDWASARNDAAASHFLCDASQSEVAYESDSGGCQHGGRGSGCGGEVHSTGFVLVGARVEAA